MRFKAEDFNIDPIDNNYGLIHPNECAKIANAKLDEWLKDAVEVKFKITREHGHGECLDLDVDWRQYWSDDYSKKLGTREGKAKLVCIEEIK